MADFFFEAAVDSRPFAVGTFLLPADEADRPDDLDPPVARGEADFAELPLVELFARADPDLEADVDFVRVEEDVDLLVFEEELPFDFAKPDALDLAETPVERPDFETEVLEELAFPDFELEAFDPAAERPEPDRLEDDDLPDPEELFELAERPVEAVLELVDFLAPDFDAAFFFEPADDLVPEDFFEEEDDFDPDDFFVAAITLIPRSSFDKTSAAIRSTN